MRNKYIRVRTYLHIQYYMRYFKHYYMKRCVKSVKGKKLTFMISFRTKTLRSSETRLTLLTRILALKRNRYLSLALPSVSVTVNQSWVRSLPSLWMFPRKPSMDDMNLLSVARFGTPRKSSKAFWMSVQSSLRRLEYLTSSYEIMLSSKTLK